MNIVIKVANKWSLKWVSMCTIIASIIYMVHSNVWLIQNSYTFYCLRKILRKVRQQKISWCINDRLEVERRRCLERANGTWGDRLTLTHAVWYISILNQHQILQEEPHLNVLAMRSLVYLIFNFAFFSVLKFVF